MKRDHRERALDHLRVDLDPELFAAQAIKHFEHEWRNLHRILSGSTAVSRHVTPTSYSLMVTSALTNVNFRLTNIVV